MKKIKYLLFFVLMTLLFKTNDVKAFSVSASSQTIYVGDAVNIYVDTSGVYGYIPAYSSNSAVLAGGDTKWAEKYSGTGLLYVFNGVAPGTVSVIVGGGDEVAYDDNTDCTETRSLTINVIARPTYDEPIDVNRTYSDNNYLSGLAIDGYDLKPEFDKDTLEYNLEVDYTVAKINVSATAEDNTANINGVGEYDLEEGKNTINVTVTAENGNQRVYVINVLVKELNPVEVKVDKKKYTLVKKDTSLPELENYIKTTIKIGDNEIPALKGSVTKYTLVGLKDEKGDMALYIYDAKKNTYTLYDEVKFANISLYYMEKDKTNYKKTSIKINGKNVTAYKKKGLDYYLIYGMNLKTGKINWYTYDSEEGTIQKYLEGDQVKVIENNNYLFLVYVLSGISILLMFFTSVLFVKYKKMN